MSRPALALALLALPLAAVAHPLAPALLQIEEQEPGTYSLFWRTSVARTAEGEVWPLLPAGCRIVGEQPASQHGAAVEQRSTLQCPHGLAGSEVSVSNLGETGINVVVRIDQADGTVLTGLLDAAGPVYRVPEPESAGSVVAGYFMLGVQHLFEGWDHLLFIAGLVLLVGGGLRLVGTVTAFTAGHSVTLALATLGWVEVNALLAEAGIALSLLVLAVELARPNPRSWIRRRPWDMAGAFGLLHGLGFAGALAATGLPLDAIPAALFGFNVGIEAGQLLVVFALLLVAAAVRRLGGTGTVRRPAAGRAMTTYVMGSLAAFWLYERLAAAAV